MTKPSVDKWLEQAKASYGASETGMYLVHNGVVRGTAKAKERFGKKDIGPVIAMDFSYDEQKVQSCIEEAKAMPGITYVNVWLNQGHLSIGDDIMLVLIGGNIRPNVLACFDKLVGSIKNTCVIENEIYS